MRSGGLPDELEAQDDERLGVGQPLEGILNRRKIGCHSRSVTSGAVRECAAAHFAMLVTSLGAEKGNWYEKRSDRSSNLLAVRIFSRRLCGSRRRGGAGVDGPGGAAQRGVGHRPVQAGSKADDRAALLGCLYNRDKVCASFFVSLVLSALLA